MEAAPSRTAMLAAVGRGHLLLEEAPPWVLDDAFALVLVGPAWQELRERLVSLLPGQVVREASAAVCTRSRYAEDGWLLAPSPSTSSWGRGLTRSRGGARTCLAPLWCSRLITLPPRPGSSSGSETSRCRSATRGRSSWLISRPSLFRTFGHGRVRLGPAGDVLLDRRCPLSHRAGDRVDVVHDRGGCDRLGGRVLLPGRGLHARSDRQRVHAELHPARGLSWRAGSARLAGQCRCRQGSGQAQPPQERGRGGHQGKSPDHSRQLDCPHWRVQPPWPVIDPAEHGRICARDQPVRHKHPAHDHNAEPGRGHQHVGPPALIHHPAARGPEPPPGQPPAQLPRPAGLARTARKSRLSGRTCRHRHHTRRAGSPAPGRILRRPPGGWPGVTLAIMCPRHPARCVSSWQRTPQGTGRGRVTKSPETHVGAPAVAAGRAGRLLSPARVELGGQDPGLVARGWLRAHGLIPAGGGVR